MHQKPNLVYILADDMGYGDVSYLNPQSAFRTPNLDRLGREGLCFTDAHATSAVCTPSRYGILTGMYNWRSPLKQGVLSGYSPALISPGTQTVASMLRHQGYDVLSLSYLFHRNPVDNSWNEKQQSHQHGDRGHQGRVI